MRATAALASILGAILIGAPVAMADPTTQAPAPEAAPPAADAPEAEGDEDPAYWEEVICRAGPRAASRLRSRQRICQTRAAWREHELQLEENAREMQTQDRFQPPEPR